LLTPSVKRTKCEQERSYSN